MAEIFFKISSGLKDLIGGQLITDKYAAVFELVKNSFDAGAKKVDVVFENIYSSNSKIIIIDDGKGMDYDDIKMKWLFVAYSAKRDGSEDIDNDFRKKSKVYAGAKGVGRFSCDRLGHTLDLYTIKKTPNSKIEHVKVNWREFEKNQKIEFDKIPVQRNNPKEIKYSIKHGTILEISDVNVEDWNRQALLDLKDKLSKLIRPKMSTETKDRKAFEITLTVPEEIKNDEEAYKKHSSEGEGRVYKNTVNGAVRNFIFEELDIRTTKILTQVFNNGTQVKTTLVDRNLELYTIIEKNTYKYLYDVSISLYYLNQAAKNIFSRKVGEQPVNYGNVFVYKNGFRIYPFGEPRDDSMGIDARGLQGYARHLQTRNLIGQIEIYQENDQLVESTSRDGGFIKNIAFNELTEYFFDKALKRLEKYVVEIADWGVDDDSMVELESEDIKNNLVKYLSNVTKDESVIDIQYNKDIIKLLDVQEEKSAKKLVKNFKRIASETNNDVLLKDANAIEKKFHDFKNLNKENVELKDELEQTKKQSLFQKSIIGREKQDLVSLQHQIRHTASSISWRLDKLIEAINTDVSKEKLLEQINGISLEVRKVASASEFVTKANFNMDGTKISADMVDFVNDYVDTVFKDVNSYIHKGSRMAITVSNKLNVSFKKRFRPLELTVIIDNLFSNSKKAGAKHISIGWSTNTDGEVIMSFKDDGKGIEAKHIDKIFDFSFSTSTSGSGIGLYHVKQIVTDLNGTVEVDSKPAKGTEFTIKFKK